MHLFALACTGIVVYFVVLAALRLVRSQLPDLGITNNKTRRLVVAGITSSIAIFFIVIAETILGTPFSLSEVAVVFGLLTLVEYIYPSMRA